MAEFQEFIQSHSLFTDFDIDLFRGGKHFKLYEKLGSRCIKVGKTEGTYFAVWAPNAKEVSVIGDFNYWNGAGYELNSRWDSSGIWEGFVPGVKNGAAYKYKIVSNEQGRVLEKGDPFAFKWETPPKTASIVWDLKHTWKDKKWMSSRKKNNALDSPFSVYEVHIGSWKRDHEHLSLSYNALADELVKYVKEMGYTHVEFMPVMEHPFFGSWGYQVTGYFAPTSRFGDPQEFMQLVESFHNAGIGVILDWVPSHFPGDAHGIYDFDGTHLYEHADPRKGYHPDWSSYIFNYGRNEVRSFLISNALFWLDLYHADGLRVDAVASMLYLDYSRKEGEWIPNEHGGRENLEAISFMKELNENVYKEFPDVQTIAEESTSFPMVSKPTFVGGLGFGMKWMMGWMNDALAYFQKDAFYRQYHQNDITFSLAYAFTENFMLPLSHDEVVHGKGPLIGRMPGDEWQRFANLRLLYGWMFTHPGTKLLFMGGEIGQTSEWKHDNSVEWHLLDHAPHQGIKAMVTGINKLYTSEPAMYELGFSSDGFEWIELNDSQNSVLSYMRKGTKEKDTLIIVANFTPVVRENYRVGVSSAGTWKEIFNSDAVEYGGSGSLNKKAIKTVKTPYHGRDNSLELNVPPLGISVLKKAVTTKKK
ncbi:1,4-alpha-glucan branching protein GlgB [Fulvivirga lutimaris]|uniref:1,4-alpha-glucan branching protein GlgB n=1 Tax=Fulvivirga lutimaris TaxID=1819566 RepID=UPI00162930FA|nr:1,4-alpha-glucan branching protein GlgB [Fulvivirga lutimaris]